MKITPGTKVLVTGAASGIGKAAALALGRRGCRLFLTDRNGEGLERTAKEVEPPGEVCMLGIFDIAEREAMEVFAQEVHRDHGPVDVLVNNAGIALFARVEDMTHEHWRKVIDVNLWGPIHGIECFLPEMIRAGRGHLVNVASVAGLVGFPLHGVYSASKSALVGLSEVLRYDLGPRGIGVTVVCPGAVDTPLKNTVEILGVDPTSPRVLDLKARFSRHAVSPEKVADLLIRAVERNRHLVLTSPDVKLLYFLKRHCFPLYHRVMLRIGRLVQA